MSRSLWRCRNPECSVEHGALLGRLSKDGSALVLDFGVGRFSVYLDTGRVDIHCPACGAVRCFRGRAIRYGY